MNKIKNRNKIHIELYQYLMELCNRDSVKNAAIKLNNGNQHNSCVYFVSEALRRVGYKIPMEICYTGNYKRTIKRNISLIYFLRQNGWNESSNLCELQPGDICFTAPDPGGHSTHTYIFMGWVDPQKQEYAYVCDNQSYDFGVTLHERNIKNIDKDRNPLYRFMYLNYQD